MRHAAGTREGERTFRRARSGEQTIGPYYLDLMKVRQDLREGKAGLPLTLRLTVVDGTRCLPIQGGHIAYTGQLFFKDEISDAVARHEPYAKHDVTRTRQDEDDVFVTQQGGGSMLIVAQLKQAFD